MALSDEFCENELPSYIDVDAAKAYAEHLGYDDSDFPVEEFEEAYAGQWNSDEEFAEQLAEDLGLLPRKHQWPTYCIDWEWAARELMYDYFSENGYYFRNI